MHTKFKLVKNGNVVQVVQLVCDMQVVHPLAHGEHTLFTVSWKNPAAQVHTPVAVLRIALLAQIVHADVVGPLGMQVEHKTPHFPQVEPSWYMKYPVAHEHCVPI